jgi:hypothetical protein
MDLHQPVDAPVARSADRPFRDIFHVAILTHRNDRHHHARRGPAIDEKSRDKHSLSCARDTLTMSAATNHSE